MFGEVERVGDTWIYLIQDAKAVLEGLWGDVEFSLPGSKPRQVPSS